MLPGVDRFDDLRLGRQVQEPAEQCGDLLVRDRLGHWTYQFAVVVDDMEQGVDVVIRGEDLLRAGLPAGPEIGAALRATLEARQDGRIPAEQELEFARDAWAWGRGCAP